MLIRIKTEIYSTEVILNAAYTFINRAFIYLDMSPKRDIIKIHIKPKNKMTLKQTQGLRGDFMNELLYSALRHQISKNNKKIRELILGRALFSDSISSAYNPLVAESTYQDDPLGIAIPWEEKYGKKRKSKNA